MNTAEALLRRGWRQVPVGTSNKTVWSGAFKGPWGSIPGLIVLTKSSLSDFSWVDFILKNPPSWVLQSPVRFCLRERADGFFAVHWEDQPKSILAGVFSIERTLAEIFYERKRRSA